MMSDAESGKAPYLGVQRAEGPDDPSLDPFELEFRPEDLVGRGPRESFVNDYGVVIGDHDYESEQSPLEQWSAETEPSVMAGEQWVHPYKDIGFLTSENRDLFERGIPLRRPFMHPAHSSAPDRLRDEEDGYPAPEVQDEP
ncbi:DUF3905 domain-containing protein [Cohnella boryungensis]|uniref:DUF3905 domain-containing protein n=2 Tax=Cohnella boryungensis TaxID=768479 RepID=A0ABV8S6T0_9BACL